MDDFKRMYKSINKQNFVSNAHTKQNRMFGFITTNIRDIGSIVAYINQLVPEYQRYKKNNNLLGWKTYCTENLSRDKQKYKRLELAKIIFRNVEKTPYLNDNAEKFLSIINKYGKNYLELFLCLYLLNGKYFDVEKQPLVAIEKIQAVYKGDLINDCKDVINNDNYNRVFYATLFFNDDFTDILYYLLENDIDISFLLEDADVKKKIKNAAGPVKFKYDLFIISNYILFKNACEKNYNQLINNKSQGIENIINDYCDSLFENNLNNFLDIKNNNKLKDLLKKYKSLIIDILYYALKIPEEYRTIFTKKTRNKNIKYLSIDKYQKCYMDVCGCNSDIHKKMYFKNKKGRIYLEGHHIIQMENSKLFKNSLDVLENIIPLCPNCHCKLHNAESKEVIKMLDIIYNSIDKEKFMKQGIFVDENTLRSFYGLEDKQ